MFNVSEEFGGSDGKMSATVSFVVPVYNVERYLSECVESILAQTFRDVEIILVDDGSTDSSGAMCDDYQKRDARVRVVHKPNGGLSDARNAGLDVAQGDFVFFVDSDDRLREDAAELLVDAAERENADFVFFNALAFRDDAPDVYTSKEYVRKRGYASKSGAALARELMIFDEYKPSACVVFFRRKFLENNRLRFKKAIYHEDELFSYRAYISAEKVAFLPEALYYRRVREGSIMTSANLAKRFRSMLTIFREISGDSVAPQLLKARNEFVCRVAKSTILRYRELDDAEKEANKDEYREFVETIRVQNGYGDVSLLARTYFWCLGVLISGIRKAIRKGLYVAR